jgi:hypothetical protein
MTSIWHSKRLVMHYLTTLLNNGTNFNKETEYSSVSQTFMTADPSWVKKITTDPHILIHIDMQCADDKYAKLKIYISDLVSYSYKYVTYQ